MFEERIDEWGIGCRQADSSTHCEFGFGQVGLSLFFWFGHRNEWCDCMPSSARAEEKNRFIILLQYLFSKCIQSSTTCLICTIWCVRSAAILSVAIYIIFATWFQFVCVANTSLVCGHRQSRTNNFLFFELCKREKTADKISTRSRVRHKRHHRWEQRER